MAQLVTNPPAMLETWVQSLGLGRSPGEGKGYTLQYSGLENSMDCVVHGVAKSRTRLSDFHFLLSARKGGLTPRCPIYSPSISCTVFLGLLLVLFALSFTDFQSSGVIWV